VTCGALIAAGNSFAYCLSFIKYSIDLCVAPTSSLVLLIYAVAPRTRYCRRTKSSICQQVPFDSPSTDFVRRLFLFCVTFRRTTGNAWTIRSDVRVPSIFDRFPSSQRHLFYRSSSSGSIVASWINVIERAICVLVLNQLCAAWRLISNTLCRQMGIPKYD
jgi:hypothetical protein